MILVWHVTSDDIHGKQPVAVGWTHMFVVIGYCQEGHPACQINNLHHALFIQNKFFHIKPSSPLSFRCYCWTVISRLGATSYYNFCFYQTKHYTRNFWKILYTIEVYHLLQSCSVFSAMFLSALSLHWFCLIITVHMQLNPCTSPRLLSFLYF